jgi:pimeloyl-ACP methyl ester carboxylesterase
MSRMFNFAHNRSWFFYGLFVIATTCIGLVASPQSAHAASCEQVKVPVALLPGQPKNKVISGTHCTPSSPSIVRSVDVLVPGGTYDSLYWDFPFNDGQYSYVKRTLAANRATFSMDRIGSGDSSKPLSAAVTFQSEAYTMHQVIQWLKASRNYADVTSIGHSVGSVVAIHEAAVYNDVDRLVVTGFLHSPSFKVITTLGTGFQPAALDPQFAGMGLDPGYVTTIPGQREKAFYSSSADRAVIAYDDSHKAIISATSLAGVVAHGLAPALLNNSQNVTVPVLTIAGDQDILCGPPLIGVDCSSSETMKAYEKNFYSRAASLTASVVPDTGHNLPLHPSADTSFNTINQWVQAH